MLHNLTKFCSEADIQLSDIDGDFWLALDRAARIEFVRAWWLDHDDKGFTSMTGADACAEFFHSKQNSIRGLQTEAFKGLIAPWQKGYVSGWREALLDAPTPVMPVEVRQKNARKISDIASGAVKPVFEADYAELESRAVGHMLAEAKDEASQQAALKFLGEAGLSVEQAQEAFEAVTSALTEQGIPAMQALVDGAAEVLEKRKTKRQPKAPKRALSWVRINGELRPTTPGRAICVCPSCGVPAHTHAEVAEIFSIRYDNKDRTKPRPQSLCGACRTKSAREKREARA